MSIEAMKQAQRRAALDRLYEVDRELGLWPEQQEPLNLNCKSVQARLATMWGYVKAEEAKESDDLYWRLHWLSKCLEGSGRIDEHECPDAYATILDAMLVVERQAQPVAVFDENLGRPKLLADAPMLQRGQLLYTAPPPSQPDHVADADKMVEQAQSRSDVQPVACLVETEQGAMVWPIADYDEASTYCDDDEWPIKLYTAPPPSQPDHVVDADKMVEQAQPVAWMDNEGERVVTSKQKTGMHESLQASFPHALCHLPPPQRQPLTDEWFRKTMLELYGIELKEGDYADDILLVRAVEAAHGIKGEA